MKRERNAKQAFIEGTVRVVARDGLDKTTTKAIATEAGLSEAYIYRCFESKEALLCAAFHMEDVAFAYFLKQNLVGIFCLQHSCSAWVFIFAKNPRRKRRTER